MGRLAEDLGDAGAVRTLVNKDFRMRTLLQEHEVRDGVARLADELNRHYGMTPVTIVGVLTGCLMLMADLVRRMDAPLRLGVIQASSYRGETERGELLVNDQWTPDIRGQHVLLLDDIFDTGHTLHRLTETLRAGEPESLRTAVLLRKEGRQETAIEPDHWAFEIPDQFVVGYGLDYAGLYRNLPYVAVLEDSDLRDSAL